MAKREKKYQDSLAEALANPERAVAYLNAHLKEEDGDSEELFLLGLRNVAMAYGVSDIARSANLGRESLYKALSPKGNPKIDTLRAVLKAMGLRLSVAAVKKKRTA